MLTDSGLQCKGMKILATQLGLVEAERFITLMLREPSDYTEWQRDLYADLSLDELLHAAQKHRQNKQRAARGAHSKAV